MVGRGRTGPTRSGFSKSRPRPACRIWCRSGTAGWPSRRSRSIAGAALPMASDLVDRPRTGHHGPALRRCPPVELRLVRVARARPGLRHQRLRRDPPRALRIRPEAARGESCRRRPRAGASTAHDNRHIVHRAMRSYRDRMAGYATMRAIDVYYARVDATGIIAYADKHARADDRGHGQGDRPPRRPPRTAEAHRRCRRRPSHRGAPADAHQARVHDPALADDGLRAYRETAPGRPPRPARPLSARGLRAQGGRCRERRACLPSWPVHRRRRRRPAVPPDQAGRGVGLRTLPAVRAAGAVTASAS